MLTFRGRAAGARFRKPPGDLTSAGPRSGPSGVSFRGIRFFVGVLRSS